MNKLYTVMMIFLLATTIKAQDFYDLSTIQTIEITFAESNWDALLDAEKAGDDGYIMAQSVSINGEVFDSVGVKYKGNSTYKANQTKNPFHIELDTYKDHDYDGYKDIKLSNVANDPSFLREVLSYQILGQYMDAPLSNYANIYVNGSLIGLYTNSEAVSKSFVKSHFGSKKNTFVKCNPPDGAGPNSTDLPKLIYLGNDSTEYYEAYEIKSDYGWDELIDLCDTLMNNIQDIEKILDVDRALWMLAFDNALVNLDSYIGQFAQNYYLYRDDNGRFVPVVWDLNESFGRFSQTGSTPLSSTADKQKMSHLLHESDATYPLVKMLLSVPLYKRMYLAHLKTIMLENFDNNSYYETGLSLQTTIDAAVQADNNKFFTYNNFISNLTSDISEGNGGPGSTTTPGITNLMDGRNTYLLALTDFSNEAPAISDIELSDENPVINTSITISASINNPIAVYLGYRNDAALPFTRIEMYDDGTHNDDVAGDGIYSTPLTIDSSFIQYYIYAENSDAGIFSPLRAEHEFHTITATLSDVPVGDIVINEFMASNESTVADQNDEFDDWVELYNNSNSSIDLTGYYLSDDADSLLLWAFPDGTSIEANSYLIIWADKDEDQEGLHANFKLSAASETLFLLDATGSIIDEVSYVDQTTDVSYGRYPNGTGALQKMTASFNAENVEITTALKTEPISNIIIYPNPANGQFYLDVNTTENTTSDVFIYDTMGKLVFQNYLTEKTLIDASQWTNGIYIAKSGNTFAKVMVLN